MTNRKTPVSSGDAPAAIGTYSQAIRAGDLVYLSGQIGLDPATMTLVQCDVDSEIRRVFANLAAVAAAAGGSLDDCVKLTVYLTSLEHFSRVNAVMEELFTAPYPARAAVGVRELPRGARVEVDAVLALAPR